MTRLKKSRRALCNPDVECPEKYLRFATPEAVAKYRADRLRCNIIVEIGSGVGFQTIEFAKSCKKVYAIEIDAAKFRFLLGNISRLGIKNVIPINADGLDPEVIKKVKDSEIAFVDTERLPEETRRGLSTVKPDVGKVLEWYKHCKGICIEVPPQIEDISLECEKEYVSLYGQLNRLNLYFGKLKSCEKKVMALPEMAVLKQNKKFKAEESKEILGFLYEINPAVIKAGMVNEAAGNKAMAYSFKGKTYLTSDKLIESSFLKTFKVIEKCEIKELLPTLKKLNARRVIPRGPMSEEEFNERTRNLEKELQGKIIYNVFFFDKAIICELL